MYYIKENLEKIKEKISIAAKKSGRNTSDITIIGVTKNVELDKIKHLLDLGVSNLGENKVQEFLKKYPIFAEKPTWHMIGRLQTNKVKYIIDKVSLIHSVDNLKLAEEINKRAKNSGKIMDILIEVNVANEKTKAGTDFEHAKELAFSLDKLGNLRICGLMTIAPNVENPEYNRQFFRKMFNLFVDIRDNLDNNSSMKFLSAGMTNDFEVAIEEGSNMVRIGTGIFGERFYDSLH